MQHWHYQLMKKRCWLLSKLSGSGNYIFLVDLYSANGSMKFEVPRGVAHHHTHTTILAMKDFGV